MLTHAPIASTSRRQLSTTPVVALYRPPIKRLRKARKPAVRPTYYGVPDRRIPPAGWENSDVAAAHPLWQFFHNKDPLPLIDTRTQHGGRAWLEEELRRKSFEDLHQLWYILLKERAVLLTQRHEVRRLHMDLSRTYIRERLAKVGKSMGRIKHVVNERRLAFRHAADILTTRALAARYPSLTAADLPSLALLRSQDWRPHRGQAEVLEAEPATPDGTWEYLAPERRPIRAVDPTAPTKDRISARDLLERSFKRRTAAEEAVRGRRRVDRAMAAQALRVKRRIEETGSEAVVPPYLARYATDEARAAIEQGVPVEAAVKVPVEGQSPPTRSDA